MNSSKKKVKKIRDLYSDWDKKKMRNRIGRNKRVKILRCTNCGSKKGTLRKVKEGKYLCEDCYYV